MLKSTHNFLDKNIPLRKKWIEEKIASDELEGWEYTQIYPFLRKLSRRKRYHFLRVLENGDKPTSVLTDRENQLSENQISQAHA